MIITYYGKQFFKLQHGDTTYALNPLAKENTLGIKPTKFGSDVALSSIGHPDYRGFENTSYNDKEPFMIYGPGNYEVDGNTIVGFPSQALVHDEFFINTIYFFSLEGISFCFLGDIESPDVIDEKTKEYIESVDVVFVPIGGNGTLSPKQANKVVKFFSPKIIIPMDYGKGREEDALEVFLKENSSNSKPLDKYVFKKSDLDVLTGTIVVVKEQ